MANQEHVSLLKTSIVNWNKWRLINPEDKMNLNKTNLKEVDLSGADLSRVNLRGSNLREVNLIQADLSGANLIEADLMGANLIGADMSGADLSGAFLGEANLNGANLSGTNLRNSLLAVSSFAGANLSNADLGSTNLTNANFAIADLQRANLKDSVLYHANLMGANLRGADLRSATLTSANLRGANLSNADFRNATLKNTNLIGANVDNANISNSRIYGVNVWDLKGEFKEQNQLIITDVDEPEITVDNIKVAQFMYLILNNKEIRDVLNTLTSKTVLILGRFAPPERKAILDALRNKLRQYDLIPIVFDFERPTDKDFTETIKTLAGMCYFVIADVTNPKSSPLELQATVPDYQIPFVPIIQEGESPFAMMVDLQKKYGVKNGGWVLETIEYDSLETLMAVLKDMVIDPAIKRHNELKVIKASNPEIKSAKDFLKQKQSQQNP